MVGKGRVARQMCILREVMTPGSDTGDEMLSHDGEEGGVIVHGQVEITVSAQVRVLGPPDGYYFESSSPTPFRNVGSDDAIIVSATTPPKLCCVSRRRSPNGCIGTYHGPKTPPQPPHPPT